MKREYYILAGDKGMKEKMIEVGLQMSPVDLLIVSEYSKLGKLIKKEAIKQVSAVKRGKTK